MRATEFTDYRQVVHAWMTELPNVRTQGLLSRRTGRATSTICMTLQGKRALHPDDAELWARAMRLEADDAAHFVDLVRLAHGTDSERREAWDRVIARQTFARRTPLPLDHEVFGRSSTWALHALVGCEGFRPDPEWIGRTLVPPLPAGEVAVAIEQLVAAGLLIRGEDGQLTRADGPVATDDEAPDAGDRWTALHLDQLEVVRAALDGPAADRHVVGVVAAVPAEAVPELVDRLEGAIRESLVLEEGQAADRVVQISFQIVARSRPTR